MKQLNQFINEKLKINKNIKSYKYSPKDKKELISIIDDIAKNNELELLNEIDVSNITDLSCVFLDHDILKNKNFDISKWDVSNCENMNNIFDGCKEFDCDLNNWNVSNVKTIYCGFRGCKSFDMNNISNWNLPAFCKINDDTFDGCKKYPDWWM